MAEALIEVESAVAIYSLMYDDIVPMLALVGMVVTSNVV